MTAAVPCPSVGVASLVAAQPPDPGSDGIVASAALLSGLIATALALARGLDRETVQWHGFLGAFAGATFGTSVYLFGLFTDLY